MKQITVQSGSYDPQTFSFDEVADPTTGRVTIASIRNTVTLFFQLDPDPSKCPAKRTNVSKSVKFEDIGEHETPTDGDTITFVPQAGKKGCISSKGVLKIMQKNTK